MYPQQAAFAPQQFMGYPGGFIMHPGLMSGMPSGIPVGPGMRPGVPGMLQTGLPSSLPSLGGSRPGGRVEGPGLQAQHLAPAWQQGAASALQRRSHMGPSSMQAGVVWWHAHGIG